MTRHLVLTEEAKRNIQAIFDWLAERSPAGADRWFAALTEALNIIVDDADRFPVAAESPRFARTVRHAVFRTRQGRLYRILFHATADAAVILHVRGPGQDLVGN